MYIFVSISLNSFCNWNCFRQNYRENQNTRFMFGNLFFENRVGYERVWKKYGRDGQAADDNIMRPMRFACRLIKGTIAHSVYVMRIAFPRKKRLRERA
jgi:hypothetical protein